MAAPEKSAFRPNFSVKQLTLFLERQILRPRISADIWSLIVGWKAISSFHLNYMVFSLSFVFVSYSLNSFFDILVAWKPKTDILYILKFRLHHTTHPFHTNFILMLHLVAGFYTLLLRWLCVLRLSTPIVSE